MHAPTTHRLVRRAGFAVAAILLIFAASAMPGGSARAATHLVTHCNDGGSGSLRAAIAAADSGDTIDMSTLACTVALQSGLQISQNSLIIEGRPEVDSFDRPVTRISGGNTLPPIRHSGTGSLTLRWMMVMEGLFVSNLSPATGGCISSQGNVRLHDTWVSNCQARAVQHDALGGAVHAAGEVTIGGRSQVSFSTARSGAGEARGGGVHAGGLLLSTTGADARIHHNHARVDDDSQSARGGGIYAAGGILAGDFTLDDNEAEGTHGDGGGIYVQGGGLASRLKISGNNAGSYGGGIYVAPPGMSLLSSLVTDNTANIGAGAYALGELIVTKSDVIGNHATYSGGGLYSATSVTIEDSSISFNHADAMVGALAARSTLIRRSTIESNHAPRGGGASLGSPADNSDTILIEQSTISGNRSTEASRSVALELFNGATIRNSTITNNRGAQGVPQGTGFGIWIFPEEVLEISSTVVTDNTLGSACADASCQANIGTNANDPPPVIVGEANLIGTSSVTLPADTIHSDAPQLGPLTHNGGPTLTHLPLPGSALIDAGKANGFATDQRGSGYPRVVGPQADIGATERSDLIFADGFDGA